MERFNEQSNQEISFEKKYRRTAKVVHPDKFGSKEKMAELNAAFSGGDVEKVDEMYREYVLKTSLAKKGQKFDDQEEKKETKIPPYTQKSDHDSKGGITDIYA